MKIDNCISFIALFIFNPISLIANPTAQLTFHVVSDDGKPLPNVPLLLSSFDHWQPGEGFGRDIYTSTTVKTDDNGVVRVTENIARGDVHYGENQLSGYYSGGGKYQFKSVLNGKWEPWNPTVEFVVKPILNPIPMYARTVGTMGSNLTLPTKNTPIAFDLEAGDWVAPYGKGTSSDFIFSLSDKGSTNGSQNPNELTLTISFPNKGDGIQSIIEQAKNQGSALRLPRFAPEGGYEPTLFKKDSQVWVHGLLQENQNYFFRVRTVLDASGNVKSALYGKIAGPIQFWDNGGIEFTYYLNPTPNDRNMEFDPKKNLFQNLSDLQQVNAP